MSRKILILAVLHVSERGLLQFTIAGHCLDYDDVIVATMKKA